MTTEEVDHIIQKLIDEKRIDLNDEKLISRLKDHLESGEISKKDPSEIGYDGGGPIILMSLDHVIDKIIEDKNWDPIDYAIDVTMYEYENFE